MGSRGCSAHISGCCLNYFINTLSGSWDFELSNIHLVENHGPVQVTYFVGTSTRES